MLVKLIYKLEELLTGYPLIYSHAHFLLSFIDDINIAFFLLYTSFTNHCRSWIRIPINIIIDKRKEEREYVGVDRLQEEKIIVKLSFFLNKW